MMQQPEKNYVAHHQVPVALKDNFGLPQVSVLPENVIPVTNLIICMSVAQFHQQKDAPFVKTEFWTDGIVG